MIKIPFNFDWNRIDGRPRWFADDEPTTHVDLPDDFCLNKHRSADAVGGAATGFIPGGEATYRKEFRTLADWQGKTVLLGIDGAYMNAEVTLNNDLLFHHPYGYTAFMVDLTKRLRAGDMPNMLSISTESYQPNTRWYSGGGLFREVALYVGGRARIAPWELFVTTPDVSAEKATVNVAINVTNDGAECAAKIALTLNAPCGCKAAEGEINAQLKAEGDTPVETTLTVNTPKLWDTDSPNLYTLRAEVIVDGEVTDTYETKVGIRKIEIDFDNGMRLNGKPIKLRGGCIHHDNTLLGSRAYPRAEERKIEILKEAGYNAIRCAHNPPSTAMLDVCDRLGMLVLDESFDMWNMGKNTLDYHLYFKDWWQFDTASMVKRDRNHPSIYCWSIGNEIPEITGKSDGAYWARVQADFVRSLDPTRPITSAIHGGVDMPPQPSGKPRPKMDRKKMLTEDLKMPRIVDGHDLWAEQTAEPASALDIVGYNYMWDRYEGDRITFPKRIIHATETHPYTTYDYWKAVEANSNVIGDFIWTAYDNLGEAGAGRVIWDVNEPLDGLMGQYPWLSCYQGDMDLDGNRRPQSYFRKILWGLDKGIHLFTTDPEHTGVRYYGMGWHWADVKQNWTFDEQFIGQPVQLEAYADCDSVDFYVNGKKCASAPIEKLKAFATVAYEPGTVEAVAIKDGAEIARTQLKTAGKAVRIALTADRPEFSADGMDLCFVKAQLVDADGVPVVNAPVELTANVSGAGTLAGFGSGNPCTTEDYGTGRRMTFDGSALIAVRAGRSAGTIELAVTASGLPAAIINLTTK